MGKVLITRKTGWPGNLCKMICYIDDKQICKLKENENFVYETQEKSCKFKCGITLGSSISEDYKIDFKYGELFCIEAKAGFTKANAKLICPNTDKEIANLKKRIKAVENKQKFSPTRKIQDYLYVDENHKLWAVPKPVNPDSEGEETIKKVEQVYTYSDIISYELLEDDNSISKSGLGKAIAGGLLFGQTGAIVGGITGKKKNIATCTKLQIRITINDSQNPIELITLLDAETKKNTTVYKNCFDIAQNIISNLEFMCNDVKIENNKKLDTNHVSVNISVPDEILKYKKLLDEGIITQDEFEAKKKQLLNL